MLHQEVITVPTKLTGVEKDILACLFLEGAFTTDLALHAGEIHNLGKTAVYATDAERTAAGLRNLCEMKLVVHDPDGRFCWLTRWEIFIPESC